jgi:hypothetical protein
MFESPSRAGALIIFLSSLPYRLSAYHLFGSFQEKFPNHTEELRIKDPRLERTRKTWVEPLKEGKDEKRERGKVKENGFNSVLDFSVVSSLS